jgi:hypothetical protein
MMEFRLGQFRSTGVLPVAGAQGTGGTPVRRMVLLAALLLLGVRPAFAQHLWWNADGQKDATAVYGQITVYATNPGTYYCGINWHPGEPAGGYCGIQDNEPGRKCTIFSIWDTAKDLHPKTIEADPATLHNRFGGEGEGAHTHLPWTWELGETFQFYVTKSPGAVADTTEVRYYVFNRKTKEWIHEATISTPDGGHKSVENFSAGAMAAFLENYTGKDKATPRLATYRLWIGKGPDTLKPVVHAGGDGTWGQLNDCYFLAGGSDENLKPVFEKLEKDLGKPIFGEKGKKLPAVTAKPVDPDVVKALKSLPTAPKAD